MTALDGRTADASLPRVHGDGIGQRDRTALRLLAGFVGGWSMAFLRNATVFLYMVMTRRRTERQFMRKLLEYV
jgi:hypothetical protein